MLVALSFALAYAALALSSALVLRTPTGRRAGLDLGLRRAHALRVPLLALAALVAGPAEMRGHPLLGNLLVLESGGAAFLVGAAAALLGGVALWAGILSSRHGAARFGTPLLHVGPAWPGLLTAPSPGRFDARPAVWLVVLMAPLILATSRESAAGGGLGAATAAGGLAAGVVAGATLLAGLWVLGLRFGRRAQALLPRAGAGLARWRALRDGYFDRETGQLHAGHAVGLFGLFVLGLGYGLGSFFFDATSPTAGRLPALVSLVALGVLITVALAGACFFLDRFRVPALLLALGVALAPGTLDREPLLDTRPRPTRRPPARAEDVFAGRDPVVVVCAEGGGIQAAGWTARVLGELDHRIPGFARGLRLFSGVSGGSVGGLYYLERRRVIGDASRALTEDERATILRAATRSALSPVALALVLRDLLPFARGRMDRGLALEEALRRGLVEVADGDLDEGTLDGWSEAARARRMPAVVFNATAARGDRRGDAGRVFTFATCTLDENAADDRGRLDFRRRFPDRDLAMVTAARASATFPWVTPMAGFGAGPHRLADGGYHDNTGFASAARVLESALAKGLLGGRKVLIVLVSAFPDERARSSREGGLIESPLLGPLSLLLSVRSATQNDRLLTERLLLARALRSVDSDLRVFVLRPDFEADAVDGLPGLVEPPLSWHLTPRQRRALAGPLWGEEQDRVLEAIRSELGS